VLGGGDGGIGWEAKGCVWAEKLNWLIKNGEQVSKPCKRGAGVMVRERTWGGGGH
jgi:hypothetical protein